MTVIAWAGKMTPAHPTGGLNGYNADVASLKGEFRLLEKNIELKISQAINSNMRWSIGIIAIIVTILKLADMVIK